MRLVSAWVPIVHRAQARGDNNQISSISIHHRACIKLNTDLPENNFKSINAHFIFICIIEKVDYVTSLYHLSLCVVHLNSTFIEEKIKKIIQDKWQHLCTLYCYTVLYELNLGSKVIFTQRTCMHCFQIWPNFEQNKTLPDVNMIKKIRSMILSMHFGLGEDAILQHVWRVSFL